MPDSRFYLQIGSIEDFITFIAVIRDKELDIEKVREQLNKLSDKSNTLKDALETADNKT